MSYSFSVKAATKEAAKKAAEEAYDAMAAQQPIHERDKAAAMANVSAVVDLLMDVPVDKQISVSMNGYVGWMLGDDQPLNSASVSASATLVNLD